MTWYTLNYIGVAVVHLFALSVVTMLWRHAPDVVQKIFLAVTGCAMAVYLFSDILLVYGVSPERPLWSVIDRVWPVRVMASSIAHGALLVYLVRQWWIKTSVCTAIKEQKL